jgi:hypothetical protein
MEWSTPDLKCRIGSELIAAVYLRAMYPHQAETGNRPTALAVVRGLLPRTASVAPQGHTWTILCIKLPFISATQEASAAGSQWKCIKSATSLR